MNKLLLITSIFLSKPVLAAPHGLPFYQSAEFWVAISFLMVVFLLLKPVSKAVSAILHNKIDIVLASIQKASALRDDAKKLLLDYQQKQKNVKKEVDDLLKTTTQQTDLLKEQALEKIKKDLQIKQSDLASKLTSLEHNAKQEIVDIITNKTISKIKEHISKKQDTKTQQKLVDKAIDSL